MDIDRLLLAQQEKLAKQSQTFFWSRNKKVIILISIVLLILYVFSLTYTYYWLPRIYQMTTEIK